MKFRTYNPSKRTKYVVLERLVCEAVSCYICNMEVYAAMREKCSFGLLVSVCSIVFHVLCICYSVKDIMP
jgi:hypothetical protein